jgi:hypothetical protein
MLSNEDLPTPSGPMNPTMPPAGTSIETSSSATTRPYRCVSPAILATEILRSITSGRAPAIRRPVDRGIEPDIGDAGQPASHQRRASAQSLRIDLHPDPEHQLVALVLRLHRLRGELRLGDDERHFRRDRYVGDGVEHDAGVGADSHLTGFVGGKIDVHIHVGDVEHGEDAAARGQHLADVRDAVLDAPVARRDERIVGDIDLVKFRVVGRRVDRAIGHADAILGGVERGDRAIERLQTLVEQFVGGEASHDQRVGSIELLLRERHLGRLLRDVRARLVETLPGLLNLRFGLSKRRFEIPGIHAGERLGRFDHVAFVGEHLGDAPGELGVDVDLVRLDPAVAECYAGRQLRLRLSPDVERASGHDSHDSQGERHPRPTPTRRFRLRVRRRDRQRGRLRRRHKRPGLRSRQRDVWRLDRRRDGGGLGVFVHLSFAV